MFEFQLTMTADKATLKEMLSIAKHHDDKIKIAETSEARNQIPHDKSFPSPDDIKLIAACASLTLYPNNIFKLIQDIRSYLGVRFCAGGSKVEPVQKLPVVFCSYRGKKGNDEVQFDILTTDRIAFEEFCKTIIATEGGK